MFLWWPLRIREQPKWLLCSNLWVQPAQRSTTTKYCCLLQFWTSWLLHYNLPLYKQKLTLKNNKILTKSRHFVSQHGHLGNDCAHKYTCLHIFKTFKSHFSWYFCPCDGQSLLYSWVNWNLGREGGEKSFLSFGGMSKALWWMQDKPCKTKHKVNWNKQTHSGG